MKQQLISFSAIWAISGVACALDADDAKALAKKGGCLKCHSLDGRKLDGPPYKEVAAKYVGDVDAVAVLTKHVTTGPKVEIDGSTETHQILKASPAEIENVIKWILSR